MDFFLCVCFLFFLYFKNYYDFCLLACLFYEEKEKRKSMEVGVEGGVEKIEKQRMGNRDQTILYENVFQLKINAPRIFFLKSV